MRDDTHECDVLVVGSGASGLAAAITAQSRGLKVLVVEKAAHFGGTTARSGGWLWVPGTHLATAQGIDEPSGAARDYLRHEAGTHFDARRVDAFLVHGPKAIAFFTGETCVQFDMPAEFPDYHAEAPGGRPGGRSMITRPFDGRELGARVRQLAPPLPELTVFGMMLGSGADIRHFMRMTRSADSLRFVARRLLRHLRDVLVHGRGMTLTNGNALAGRLMRAAMDRDIPLWLSAPVTDLIVEAGSVVGAKVSRGGREVAVRVRRGVVLACGGFPHDLARRARLFAHAPTGREHFTPSPETNTGDGLRLAAAVGGAIDESLPNVAAWVPTSVVVRHDGKQGVMPHFIDRAKPGVIAITRQGRRFANEADSYHDFVQEMVAACRGGSVVSCWLVCDHRALRRYGLGCVPPFPMPIGRYVRNGYLRRGRTLSALAREIGVDAVTLQNTVDAFNRDARDGSDTQFGKGSTAYNRYQGDPAHAPNPCLAPLADGPFYAIKLVVGDIGTFSGVVTDEHARVQGADSRPIPGLYAVGNDAASVMGGAYPGAGITLGPALTFGYVAGLALAGAGASIADAEGAASGCAPAPARAAA